MFARWSVVLLVLVALVFGLKTLWEDKQEQRKSNAVNRELPLVLKGPEMRQYLKAHLDYAVTSDLVSVYISSKKMKFQGFKARFKNDSGGLVTVESNSAVYNTSQGMLQLKGAVKLNQPEGIQMETEKLFFQLDKKILYNQQPVLFKHPKFIIKGTHLYYRLSNGYYRLKKPDIRADLNKIKRS